MDVARRAAAAAAAQGQQFVEAVFADDFHHGQAGTRRDGFFSAVAGDDRELRHVWS
jgi:hypothetical protein